MLLGILIWATPVFRFGLIVLPKKFLEITSVTATMEETVGYSMPASMPEPEAQPERCHSEPANRSRLAEPLTFALSGRTAPNRFMKAAMTEQLCTF
jgi:hypothetical protein